MLPPGDRNCPVRNRCKELLAMYKGDELQLKLAESTADEWLNMYQYKPFSLSKPQIAVNYVNMSAADKKMFDKSNPEWHESEEMRNYANKENDSIRTMESHKEYLISTLKCLKADVSRREKVRSVLAGYPQAPVRMVQPTAHWED